LALIHQESQSVQRCLKMLHRAGLDTGWLGRLHCLCNSFNLVYQGAVCFLKLEHLIVVGSQDVCEMWPVLKCMQSFRHQFQFVLSINFRYFVLTSDLFELDRMKLLQTGDLCLRNFKFVGWFLLDDNLLNEFVGYKWFALLVGKLMLDLLVEDRSREDVAWGRQRFLRAHFYLQPARSLFLRTGSPTRDAFFLLRRPCFWWRACLLLSRLTILFVLAFKFEHQFVYLGFDVSHPTDPVTGLKRLFCCFSPRSCRQTPAIRPTV